MREKVYSYLGFAKRSRSLITGYNSCIFAINKKKVKLLILAKDTSENTQKKFISLADNHQIKIHIFGTKEELSHITGTEERGIFAITDENLAKAIEGQLSKEEKEGKG